MLGQGHATPRRAVLALPGHCPWGPQPSCAANTGAPLAARPRRGPQLPSSCQPFSLSPRLGAGRAAGAPWGPLGSSARHSTAEHGPSTGPARAQHGPSMAQHAWWVHTLLHLPQQLGGFGAVARWLDRRTRSCRMFFILPRPAGPTHNPVRMRVVEEGHTHTKPQTNPNS